MDLNLFGKNALVCGSSKGIGKACAIQLAAIGANVTLVSRSPEKMAAVVREMEMRIDKNQDHDWLVADFSDFKDLQKRVKGLLTKCRYQILINNTGGPPGGPITEADSSEFERAFNQHLLCNHTLVQLLKPGMIESGYGRVINIISTSVKAPLDNLGVSNTIRGAVASWAKTMANELGVHGITVNNVLPGLTQTDRLKEIINVQAEKKGISYESVESSMTKNVPLGRIADPLEVGSAVAFLASPVASYINGINLPVDGGRTRSL